MPELQYLRKIKKISKKEIEKKIGINFKKKTFLVNFHPITTEVDKTKKYILEILSVLHTINYQAIFTYPNADKGNEVIINEINKFVKNSKEKKYIFIKNAGAELYANLLRNCYAMIGNSSSGIVEAASFKMPVINIGNRQKGKVFQKMLFRHHIKEKILKNQSIVFQITFIKKLKNLKILMKKYYNKKNCKFNSKFKNK